MKEILGRIIKKLKEKFTMNWWKTPEEYIPEDGTEVLVYRLCSCRLGNTPHITLGVYYKNSGWYDLQYDMQIHDVILWRYFPKIPKEFLVEQPTDRFW